MNTFLHRLAPACTLVVALGLFVGCGPKGHDAEHGDEHAHDHDHHGKHEGALVESDDQKAHFEIVHHADEKKVSLYVYDGEMAYRGIGEAPVLNLVGPDGSVTVTGVMGAKEGEMAACEWHFAHDLLSGKPDGRFRVKIGSKGYMPKIVYEVHDHKGHDHDGHDHHEEGVGPHDGMVAKITGPNGASGFVELKLHDDKGDLELWIAKDEHIETALDLPLDTKITLTFTKPKATTVTLAVRNTDENEDEDGTANNRSGKTNYFIFPGESGADASWLMGKDFDGMVTVSFQDGSGTWTSEAFDLEPHTHHEGEHDHD